MSRYSTDAFRHLFFDSDEYARRSGVDIERQDSDVQMLVQMKHDFEEMNMIHHQ
jgi:hypothetical protein